MNHILTETEELLRYKRLQKKQVYYYIFFLGLLLGATSMYSLVYFGKLILPAQAIENQLNESQKNTKESKSEFQ
ncbi:hypothetical protein U0035_03390 [Niabella yanshanensis]|uniref:Nitrogen regulatory IIA protein n=1 Tax=Niabella yanshanensis TaxID=577386 RepID=A0ABZ0W9M1_9BACT|nr:hypothetical protein [Niabella yanshanensis]WQD39192.1 hypothetical protein U0035_03390 [Niabella yanshanensis]